MLHSPITLQYYLPPSIIFSLSLHQFFSLSQCLFNGEYFFTVLLCCIFSFDYFPSISECHFDFQSLSFNLHILILMTLSFCVPPCHLPSLPHLSLSLSLLLMLSCPFHHILHVLTSLSLLKILSTQHNVLSLYLSIYLCQFKPLLQ